MSPVISYAQNYEDVMLWRALQHVENGFYIDVGANDHIIESVTKLFYERNWSGINIEPLKIHFEDLKNQRARDVNLNCAAGDKDGELELWEYNVRGWATADPKVVEMHEAAGYKGTKHKVPVLTLASICEKYASSQIHFMKIDVEGLEKEVLEGMDFRRHRPWIVLVEATKPNSREETYKDWEGIVLSQNYTFGYSDGLNRFYIANEKKDLLESFNHPPNVFDQFIRAEQYDSEIRAQKAEARLEESEARACEKEAYIDSLINSRSWRLTAPFRIIAENFKSVLHPPIKFRAKVSLQHAMLYIQRRPRIKRLVLSIINRFPLLKNRLVLLRSQKRGFDSGINRHIPQELKYLSSHARRIYSDLKNASNKSNGKGR